MTLTIANKTITLDSDDVDCLLTDLVNFKSQIDQALIADSNRELTQQQVEALLTKLNLLVDVYS